MPVRRRVRPRRRLRAFARPMPDEGERGADRPRRKGKGGAVQRAETGE